MLKSCQHVHVTKTDKLKLGQLSLKSVKTSPKMFMLKENPSSWEILCVKICTVRMLLQQSRSSYLCNLSNSLINEQKIQIKEPMNFIIKILFKSSLAGSRQLLYLAFHFECNLNIQLIIQNLLQYCLFIVCVSRLQCGPIWGHRVQNTLLHSIQHHSHFSHRSRTVGDVTLIISQLSTLIQFWENSKGV